MSAQSLIEGFADRGHLWTEAASDRLLGIAQKADPTAQVAVVDPDYPNELVVKFSSMKKANAFRDSPAAKKAAADLGVRYSLPSQTGSVWRVSTIPVK